MKISFVGGGNMARSLIGGLIDSGIAPENIGASDPLESVRKNLERDFRIATHHSNQSIIANAETVVVAVKPQQLQLVLNDLSEHLPGKLLISLVAGVRMNNIVTWSGHPSTAVVRCMPNTPALLACGATGLIGNEYVSEQQKQRAEKIINAVGISAWVDDESQLDAITALSGSGPAYFFLMLECMIESAEKMGITADTAKALAIQTALGAARMAGEVSETPAQLRRNVTSPAGTTEAAIKSFNNDNYREIVHRAMQAAANRAIELGNELGTNHG